MGASADQPPAPAPAATSRVIVQWAPGTGPAEKATAREEAEVSYSTNLGSPLFQLVEVDEGQATGAAVAELEDDPAVVLAERDGYRSLDDLPDDPDDPDDPLFDQLWGLDNTGAGIDGFSGAVVGADIDAEAAWLRTLGSPGIVVADIDSGFEFEHPDLGSVVWTNAGEIAGNGVDDDGNGYVDDVHGYDFVGANADAIVEDADPSDDDLISGGHGVHTAGTIAAAGDNGVGIVGVAPQVRLLPLRVCSRRPSVSANRCPVSAIINAINYAGNEGVRVANISLGGTVRSQAEVNALAENPRTLFVVSAGNEGQDNDTTPHYPCNFNPAVDSAPAVPGAVDNVLCVAATDQADALAGFSDWGSSSVDLGAPGTETLSTYPLSDPFVEAFTDEDFATKWSATGTNGGFERTDESPLTSFGATDSAGAPTPSSVRESTSQAFVLPPNQGCVLLQQRHVELATGDQFRYSVLLDGVERVASSTTTKSVVPGMETRSLNLPASFDVGGQAQVRLRFTAGAATEAGSGVWVDDLRLRCRIPTYRFLEGTSMAAPHVSGTVALLLSLHPGASVGALKTAVLGTVDAVPELSGKAASGGRLNAAAATDRIDELVPAAPTLDSTSPPSPAESYSPQILGTAPAGSTVRIYAGATCAGAPVAAGGAEKLASTGIQVPVPAETTREFSATATDAALSVSTCSAPISFANTSKVGPSTVIFSAGDPPSPPPPSCKVPKLARKSLARAKAALKRAGCAFGKATKPKPRKGRPAPKLVVRSSRPGAGVRTAGKVNLRLGPKPKAK